MIVPGTPLSKETQLGLDLKGGVELVYEGRADAAGAEGHAAGGRRRDRDDPQAHRLARRLGARDPARRRATRSRSACRTCKNAERAEEQVGTTAQLQFYDWEPNVLGRPRPGLAVRGHARRCSRRSRRLEAEGARPRPPTSRPGSDLTPGAGRQGERHRQRTRYYLFGPDELPIGPDKQAAAHGQLRAVGHLQGPAVRLRRRRPGTAPKYAKGTECLTELKALGSGGPPAGSQVDQGARGHRGRRGTSRRRTSRRRSSASRARGRLRAVRHGHQEPRSRTPTRSTNAPIVTMEFTDKGRKAFARVTKRIAERGSTHRSCRRAPTDRSRPSSASRSRSTTRSSRWRRSTSSRTPRASTAAPAPRSRASATSRRRRTSPRACASARCRSS